MTKRRSASSARDKRQKKSAKHTSDAKLNFSDIPELTEEELSQGRRVGRPRKDIAKQLIAFRIDPGLLARLQKLAAKKKKPYQTLLHELLEAAVDKAA